MKNLIKTYIILAILIAVVVPSVALAAWWNPFSWGVWNRIFHFQKTEQSQCKLENQQCGSAFGKVIGNCCDGFECKVDSNVPDASAKCVKKSEAVISSEKACVQSGGKVANVDCYCANTQDFFNTCLVGGCACAPNPNYKKQVKSCDCGEGKCWDGKKCTDLNFGLGITEETANWKTYTNKDYEFELKYPSDWNFHTNKTGGYILTKQHDANWGPSGATIDFSFSVCKLSEQSCADKKKDFDTTTAFYSKNQNVELNLNGVSGKQWVIGAAAYGYSAGVVKNGNFYVFGSNVEEYETRYPNNMSDKKVKAIFDSIKFTK